MRSVAIMAMIFAAMAGLHAQAQDIGSPIRGKAYSQERCADCHAIDTAAKSSPVRAAPTFAKIANTPGMTPMALTAWLHSSHNTMPSLIVKGDDLNDLIAYIRSLKTPAADEK